MAMAQNEILELELWEYLEGNCSPADATRIARLIAEDSALQKKYEELKDFHLSMAGSIEPEQPSLRFSKNVMEQIASLPVIYSAPKSYVNPAVIKGLAAFFILSLAVIGGYTVLSVNWNAGSYIDLPKIDLPTYDTSHIFNASFFYGVSAVTVVLGLVLTDLLLRKRMRADH